MVEERKRARPLGYAVVRYVFARNAEKAKHKAVERERESLNADFRRGFASATFETDDIERIPIWRFFSRRYGRAYFEAE